MYAPVQAFLVVMLCLITGSSCNQPFTADMIAWSIVSGSNKEFSQKLYKTLINDTGNLVISPLSAQTVLTMAWLGSGGPTALELENALALPRESQFHTTLGFKNLLQELKSTSTVTLDLANKLYLQQGFQVNDTYKQTLVQNFKSDVQEVNFYNETEAARTTINQWVEEKTHQKIKDLIAEGTLSESALLVAVNALYFKGGWAKPFEEQDTTNESFHVSADKTVDVKMMHKIAYFYHTQNSEAGVQILKMKYRGENDDRFGDDQKLSMVIVLPDQIDGLPAAESLVTKGNLTRLLETLYFSEVNVSLPRFKIEKSVNLKDALIKLGVTTLFQPSADLSGISNENIYVSQVIQKGIVEVTEKGTEAAAATFFEAIPMSASIPCDFRADHPFLFLILDEVNDVILFLGRVVEPK